MGENTSIDQKQPGSGAPWMLIVGLLVAIAGSISLIRVPFVIPQKNVGWYILFGLPLAGVGVAVCGDRRRRCLALFFRQEKPVR
jgi:hypothetical protein